jgi:hypothetical protein
MAGSTVQPGSPSRAGGAAMAGGQRFQARVTAWWCARILLQTPGVGEPFDLPPTSVAERVYCETTDSVDDIRVELTGGEQIFGQAKRSLILSSSPGGVWASVLIQFYGELQRALPVETERRLVLFYEEPNRSLTRLGVVLNRYRGLPPGTPLINAARNKSERQIVDRLNTLIDALQAKPECSNLATRREELLRLTYIKQLHLGSGEADYLRTAEALQDSLLTNPAQANQVLISLHRLADDLLAERGSVDRLALRRRLKSEGIVLRDSPDYRPDFEKLDDWSTREITFYEAEGRSKLAVAEEYVTINRPVVQEMLEAAQEISFLVVGGAGTGKTGCLLSLAEQLRTCGHRVWYWAADSLPYLSPEEIGNQLRLQHPWEGLLAEAASGIGATLIIDGLDGLRDTCAQRAYRKLIALVVQSGARIVAAIRSFDLQYATDLQEVFASAEPSLSLRYSDDAFKEVSHIAVPELDNEECDQVIAQLSSVQQVLDAIPQLQSAVRNLFSLDLLCKLIDDGDLESQLSAISTQAELFERYWTKRVTAHELHEEITKALRDLVRQMVDQQTLQVTPDEWPSQVKDAVFSAGLVRHPPSPSGRLPKQQLVSFNHHLLFDYAAERLFVRPRRDHLAVELASPDTWGLFLRPSLVMCHRYAWHHGRLDFWDTLVELERCSVPVLQQLPGHLVVAEEARSRDDLQPMLEGSLGDDSDNSHWTSHWTSVIQGVVTAATFSSLPRLFSQASGDWWIEFARDLICTGNVRLVYIGRRLLFSASDALDNLSAQSHLFLNQAAVTLVKFHWTENIQPSNLIRPAIGWVCRTIGSDLPGASEIVRKILTPEELQHAGYIQAWEIAHHIADIWQADPSLAVEVYDGVFGYVETDRSSTPLGGLILPMASNRAQDYRGAYYALSEQFPAFLSAHPKEATRALVQVLRHYCDQKRQRWYQPTELRPSPPVKAFTWDGRECRLQADLVHISDDDGVHADYQIKMLHRWEYYLMALPEDDKADEKWEAISDVLVTDNELATIWSRLLTVGSRSSAFYAQRLWTMLINPPILVGLGRAAGSCIVVFVPCLQDEAVRQIEEAVFSISEEQTDDADIEPARRCLARTQAWLLSCIPEQRRSLVVKEFLSACDSELLRPYYSDPIVTSFTEDVTTEKWRARAGVDVARYQELLQISAFLENLTSNDVTDASLAGVLKKIRQVEQALVKAQDGIDSRLASTIQERLICGFAQVACSQAELDRQLTDELFKRFKQILSSPGKPPLRQHLEQFDVVQGWGSLDPRANAAEAFVCLAAKAERLSEEHEHLLRRLAADSDPVMQFHLGRRIWSFLEEWPEFVWETLEHWIAELPTRPGTLGVLSGTLGSSWFWWLRNSDPVRANQLLRSLLASARSRDARMLRRACGMLLAALSFFRDEPWTGEIIDSAIESVRENLDELAGAQTIAISELLPRTQKEARPTEQRRRATEFLLRLLIAADQALEVYRAEITNLHPPDRPSEPPEWVRQVADFFDGTAEKFMFSAKEHAQRWVTIQDDEKEKQIAVWWETVEPIIDALLAMPHPKVAYGLITGLEYLASLDVQRSLYWLRRATLASVPQGLATESLAADHTIGILARILAEHKASLAVGTKLRSDFVQVLEAYLQVGWPKAMELAIQLDSIFR